MTEEESTSVFGGLADAAEAAWDAQVNVTEAIIDTSIGASQFGLGIGEHLAATGAELIGLQDARDSLDDMAVDNRDAAYDSFSSAGENLSEAATDIVGE
jgi:hypothetical protein